MQRLFSCAMICVCFVIVASMASACVLCAQEARFPTVGIAFDVPAGLHRIAAGGPNIVAVMVKPGESLELPEYAIVVEITPQNGRTLKSYAEAINTRIGASRSDSSLAGETAVELTLDSDFETLRPVRSKITEKEGYFISILLRSKSGKIGVNDFNAICTSLRWIEREAPAKHLELGPKLAQLGGAISLQLPKLVRSYPVEDPRSKFAYGIYNYKQNHEEFFIQGALLQTSSDKSLEDVAASFTETLGNQLNFAEKLTWSRPKPQQPLITSKLVAAKIQIPNGPEVVQLVRYAFYKTADDKVVLVQFGVTDAADSDVGLYDRCIDEICNSITPAQKTPQ